MVDISASLLEPNYFYITSNIGSLPDSGLAGSSGEGTLVSRYRRKQHEQGERHQSHDDFWRHEKQVPMQSWLTQRRTILLP
ncbi:hypothetical protein OAK98_06150 [Mariniblastus sp.]|nr:hypothetical protein [Mariniblastus sp.]MDC0294962.1 hypothetical protein [Mariniblastus sp.]